MAFGVFDLGFGQHGNDNHFQRSANNPEAVSCDPLAFVHSGSLVEPVADDGSVVPRVSVAADFLKLFVALTGD
jgi:hypothetical protein